MAILKDLIVHGSSRFLNKIYANELETPLINADEARFTKLIAKDASLEDATVTGLLDVQGQLHTNTWTNSSISTIEGSFYIMPTLSNMTDSDSNVLTFIASTENSYPIVSVQIGSNQAFAGMGSLQFETVAGVQNDTAGWTGGSKVLLTGEVKVGSEWLPLGTIVGTLYSFNSDYSSIEIKDLKDNKGRRPAPILLNFPLGSQIRYRNLKISLCERYISGNSKYYPIGIYMTALGSNGKTFLDIYGGGQEANVNNAGGLARPNVRIGNLNGLPSIGSQTPHGWGIYTTHGYFSGTVVADTGNIGGWSLTADSIWKGNQAFKNSEGMYFGSAGISLGSTFSVSNSGVLTATNGHIGGWNLTQEKLSIGEIGEINSAVINPGTELEEAREIGGSEELNNWIFTAGANFGVTGDGTLYANNANITGTINATEGNIGGIEIVDGRLQGENFGIEENGDIYINNANVTGTIIATSGNIGGIEIDENGRLNLSSLSIGDFKDANEYAQKDELQISKKITTYYLASSKSSDVVFEDEGWSLATPTVDENKKYLWAYQVRKGKENHDEGSIISFENDGDSILFDNLIVDIDPVQDLHGQDAPYPAGGGKNLFNPDTVVVGYINDTTGELTETSIGVNSRASEYIAVDGGTSYFFANSAPSGRWGAWYDENKGYISSCNGVGVKTAPSAAKYVRITVSQQNNNPDYADNVMVAKSTTEIPWSPYSNICPISGWTGVTAQRTGKNLLNPDAYLFSETTRNGLTYTVQSDGTVKVTGTATAVGGPGLITSVDLPNGTYSYKEEIEQHVFCTYRKRDVNTGATSALSSPFTINGTFVVYANLYCDATGTYDLTIHPQIEYGTTATSYEPYQGNTYSVDWTTEAGTVYGGTIDVVSGELVVDRAMVDMGTLSWNYSNTTERFQASLPNRYGGADRVQLLCSNYKANANVYSDSNRTVGICCNGISVFVRDFDYTDAATFKSAMSGVQLVYELATPQTYQLTPTEVKSLLGQNNVWADTGDVELTYSTNAVRGNPYLIGMEDVNGAVNSLQNNIDDLSSTVNDYLGTWITLGTQEDDNGNNIPIMRLGSSSDPLSPKIQAVLTNEKLDFRVNNNSVAYIAVDTDDNNTGKLFASNNLVASEIQFGDWVWYQRRNGHLSVKWKGGNNS